MFLWAIPDLCFEFHGALRKYLMHNRSHRVVYLHRFMRHWIRFYDALKPCVIMLLLSFTTEFLRNYLMSALKTDSDIIIGAYYELDNGSIAYLVHWNGPAKTGEYKTDNGKKVSYHPVSLEQFQTWTVRRDLHDFPNASDPRLPYVFDLYWDLKYTSDLKRELAGHDAEDEIRQTMAEHKIKI